MSEKQKNVMQEEDIAKALLENTQEIATSQEASEKEVKTEDAETDEKKIFRKYKIKDIVFPGHGRNYAARNAGAAVRHYRTLPRLAVFHFSRNRIDEGQKAVCAHIHVPFLRHLLCVYVPSDVRVRHGLRSHCRSACAFDFPRL